MFFSFNVQDLVSNILFITADDNNQFKKQKNISYKKALYNKDGKIVELKEYKTKDFKQFEKLISKKGEDFFLNMLFKDMIKHFEFIPFETTTYTYKKDRLSCSETTQHYSRNTIFEKKYKYDNHKRLIEINTSQDNESYEKETYTYD